MVVAVELLVITLPFLALFETLRYPIDFPHQPQVVAIEVFTELLLFLL